LDDGIDCPTRPEFCPLLLEEFPTAVGLVPDCPTGVELDGIIEFPSLFFFPSFFLEFWAEPTAFETMLVIPSSLMSLRAERELRTLMKLIDMDWVTSIAVGIPTILPQGLLFPKV
jgi:hypothetical protein